MEWSRGAGPSPAPAGAPDPGARPPPGPAAQGSPQVPGDERTWATLTHLSALLGLFLPFGNILAPLVMWLLKKDTSNYVDHHGKEALNFHIFITILFVILGAFLAVGILLSILLIGVPILVLAAIAMGGLGILVAVFVVVATIEANKGTWYRYPFTYRFIR